MANTVLDQIRQRRAAGATATMTQPPSTPPQRTPGVDPGVQPVDGVQPVNPGAIPGTGTSTAAGTQAPAPPAPVPGTSVIMPPPPPPPPPPPAALVEMDPLDATSVLLAASSTDPAGDALIADETTTETEADPAAGEETPPVDFGDWAYDADLEELLQAWLDNPNPYASEFAEAERAAMDARLRAAETAATRNIEEWAAARGLVGSDGRGMESGRMVALQGDLQNTRLQEEAALLDRLVTGEAEGRQAAFDAALQLRAQHLQEQGMEADEAYRQADLELREYIANQQNDLGQQEVIVNLLMALDQMGGLTDEMVALLSEYFGIDVQALLGEQKPDTTPGSSDGDTDEDENPRDDGDSDDPSKEETDH